MIKSAHSPQPEWHIQDWFGRRYSCDRELIRATLRSDNGRVVVICLLLVMIISDPLRLYSRSDQPLAVLSYLLLLPIYALCHWVILNGAASLRKAGWLRHWPLLVSTLLSAVIVTVPFLHLMANVSCTHALFCASIYAVLIGIFETLFLRFVVPAEARALWPEDKVTAAAGTSAESPNRPTADQIFVGGLGVDLDELLAIEARQHHLCIHLKSGEVTRRARLRDVLAQVPEGSGIQPHRSWWVASHAVTGMIRRDGKPLLQLAEGPDIPVARARLDTVTNWLDRR